jgi:hypothetical protein
MIISPEVPLPAASSVCPDKILGQLFGAPFAFLVNGTKFETGLTAAVALSPFLQDQFSGDAFASEFTVFESDVSAADILSVQNIISGETTSFG